jgi:hypothetical protein
VAATVFTLFAPVLVGFLASWAIAPTVKAIAAANKTIFFMIIFF